MPFASGQIKQFINNYDSLKVSSHAEHIYSFMV